MHALLFITVLNLCCILSISIWIKHTFRCRRDELESLLFTHGVKIWCRNLCNKFALNVKNLHQLKINESINSVVKFQLFFFFHFAVHIMHVVKIKQTEFHVIFFGSIFYSFLNSTTYRVYEQVMVETNQLKMDHVFVWWIFNQWNKVHLHSFDFSMKLSHFLHSV